MHRILAMLGGLLLSALAAAAVNGEWQVNLLRSGVTFAVAKGTTQELAWQDCQNRIAVQPAGTIRYTCQTPRYVATVTANQPLPPPPAPVDCVVSAWSDWTGGAWSSCLNGVQTRQESRVRFVITAPANGGAACPALTETRLASQVCTAPTLGQATVSWTPPATREDGSALTDLAGYRLRYGPAPGDYPGLVTITNPGLTMYVITDLMPGTYFFTLAAYDSADLESVAAGPVSKTL